jgi:hypothetical protein
MKIINAKGDDKFFGMVALSHQQGLSKRIQADSHMVFMTAMNVRKPADERSSEIRAACTVSEIVLAKFSIDGMRMRLRWVEIGVQQFAQIVLHAKKDVSGLCSIALIFKEVVTKQ